jgi:hypothetical protein
MPEILSPFCRLRPDCRLDMGDRDPSLMIADSEPFNDYRSIDRYCSCTKMNCWKAGQVLRKSCFEGCKHLDHIDFEIGSEVERIGAAALRDCVSLSSIVISASVTIIEESSFEGCAELESCFIAEDSSLVTIDERTFAKCASLRSFSIPGRVGEIGENCFSECVHLYQFEFTTSDALKRVVGNRSLDDALDEFGMSVNASSSLFRIELEDGGPEFEFEITGWVSIQDGEGDFHLTLVQDIE